jgi:hypothetical protein
MTKAYDNSILARNINVSGVNTNVSGVLQLNNIDVSLIRSYTEVSNFPASGVSNTYYLASDSSRIYQWTGSQYVEMGPSLDTISASNITFGTLSDSRLSSNVPLLENLSAWVNQASTAIDTLPRNIQNTAITLTSGSMILTFFTPLVTRTITQITASSGATVGSGLTLVRFGLYTFNETNATLVAAVASDTSLFTAANTVYTRSLSTGGGLPSSYTLNAGSRYGFALLATGTTMPTIIGLSSSGFNLATITPRVNGQVTSQTNLPATFVVGNISVTTNAHCARFS